jgi:N-methylhydantoinase B
VRIDGVQCPPWGVAGGQSGRPGRAVVNPGTPQERVLAPLSDGNRLVRGDILLIETGGGGGHGHPFDRPAQQVLDDVEGGFVSAEAALHDYGVVIRDAVLDQAATAARRQDRPASKAFHRMTYADVLE